VTKTLPQLDAEHGAALIISVQLPDCRRFISHRPT